MSVLCRRCGVSRKTGYKWRDRYAAEGAAGLAERSHSVHACPYATAPDAVQALYELCRRHSDTGAEIAGHGAGRALAYARPAAAEHRRGAAQARRLKTLRGLTPYECVCKTWADEPHRFTRDPTRDTVGPNS